jgi:hypothetical protein
VQDKDMQHVRTDKRLATWIIRNLMCALKSVEREYQIRLAFQGSQIYGTAIGRYCTSVHTATRRLCSGNVQTAAVSRRANFDIDM